MAVELLPVSPPAPVGPVVPPEPVVLELDPPSGWVLLLMRPLMLPVQPTPAKRPMLKKLRTTGANLRIGGVVPRVTFHQADRSRKKAKKCRQPIAIPAIRMVISDARKLPHP